MPSRVGTSILAPRIASDTLIGTSTWRFRPVALEVRVGFDLMVIVRSPAGAPLAPGSPLPLEPELGPGVDARRDLDDQALRLAARRAEPRSSSRPRLTAVRNGMVRWASMSGRRAGRPGRPPRTRPIRSSKMLGAAGFFFRGRRADGPAWSEELEKSTVSNPGSPNRKV